MGRSNVALTAQTTSNAIIGIEKEHKDSVHDSRHRTGSGGSTTSDGSDGLAIAPSEPDARQSWLMAQRTSTKERKKLHEERSKLALKHACGELTASEKSRLDIVRWMLEQIELAEMGPALSRLERVADLIDGQSRQIQRYVTENRSRASAQPFFLHATPRKKK